MSGELCWRTSSKPLLDCLFTRTTTLVVASKRCYHLGAEGRCPSEDFSFLPNSWKSKTTSCLSPLFPFLFLWKLLAFSFCPCFSFSSAHVMHSCTIWGCALTTMPRSMAVTLESGSWQSKIFFQKWPVRSVRQAECWSWNTKSLGPTFATAKMGFSYALAFIF